MIKSPIPYTGGKTQLLDKVLARIPYCDQYLEPFMGGHVVGLNLALRGATVYASDINASIVSFWKSYYDYPQRLYDEVMDHADMDRAKYNMFRDELSASNQTLHDYEIGARILLLHRHSFRAFGMAGGYSKGADRRSHKSLQQLLYAKSHRTIVEHASYEQVLANDKETFAYLDPPYLMSNMADNRCYGRNGEDHKDFDHKKLYEILKDRPAWLLSYSDHPDIRDLYKDFKIEEVGVRYGNTQTKLSTELLISPTSHSIH